MSQHAHVPPISIPTHTEHTGSDDDITALVAAFEKYDFRNDQEFRAGLPSVIKSVKGRGSTAADIDDMIARAQWFYFTRQQQSQVPFDTYLRYRSGETESVPMGSSVNATSPTSAVPPSGSPSVPSGPPPAFSSQDPCNEAGADLAPPTSNPPPFSSRPPSPPAAPFVKSALPERFDTDGEGGITVTRACISRPASVPTSRAPSPPLRDATPAASTPQAKTPQAAPEIGFHAPSTGASALPTPGLTSSSEASTPDLSGGATVGATSVLGARTENRLAVAAEMAAPSSDHDAASAPAAVATDTAPPAPIETTAPGPDGPQLPFDEVVRLISTGHADEVPHHEIPDGLNDEPASMPQMTARPKPWERAGPSSSATAAALAAPVEQ